MTSPEESRQAELHEVARGLYGLPPDEFTAARTRAVAEARGRDRELAAAIKALRRPAVAAWAVNLLVRERAELLAQVEQVGESLREASSQLEGGALRDLTRQRRQLVQAVAREVEKLAQEHGQRLAPAALRQVEDTLNAAITDRRAAEALRSGVLAQPLSSTGLASLAEALGVPGVTASAPGRRPEQPDDREPRPGLTVVAGEGDEVQRAEKAEKARKKAQKAQKALAKATKAHDKAVRAHAKAQARLLQLEAGLEELRRQVAAAEAEAEDAASVVAEREAEVTATRAALADATSAAELAAEQARRQRG